MSEILNGFVAKVWKKIILGVFWASKDQSSNFLFFLLLPVSDPSIEKSVFIALYGEIYKLSKPCQLRDTLKQIMRGILRVENLFRNFLRFIVKPLTPDCLPCLPNAFG